MTVGKDSVNLHKQYNGNACMHGHNLTMCAIRVTYLKNTIHHVVEHSDRTTNVLEENTRMMCMALYHTQCASVMCVRSSGMICVS